MNFRNNSFYKNIQRISHVLYLKGIPFIPGLLMRINRVIFTCEIPYTNDIPSTVTFGHNALGTVIHPESPIGENTLIMQHVTVGGNMGKTRMYNGESFSSPIIGKNVFIGPGANLLGPILIGDNAQIGASAVVLQDVPEGKTAVGIPAKII